ncbi:MAG: hypothetical protein KBD78_04625 [Oligoflexales bacterium]|nr:hypothetical protein [Oligoflexales bacterium]
MRFSKKMVPNLMKFSFATTVALAFFSIYMSYEMTKVGYSIGELKHHEIELLEQQSQLNMNLEKLTTKEHLVIMAYGKINHKKQGQSNLALK